MRRFLLVITLISLSACQLVSPSLQSGENKQAASNTAQIEKKTREATLREVERGQEAIPETPIQPDSREPSLHNWINYQLHIASLTRNVQEELWRLLDQRGQTLTPYQKLQFVVISLHYPPQRHLGRLGTALEEVRNSAELNEDSRRYAQQLALWISQLQRYENETFRLRQLLEAEKTSKQELEEKIRKLTDIEETLNQRQRDREP